MVAIASAQIGEVHRAWQHDGRQLSVDVQCPGVAASIDVDIYTVAKQLRLSGFLPQRH